ncbi:MAG TPA: hypothetical protein VLZ12_13425 [Verrucomicrobiae bacterium]|nr:hypothetical protein [Verrucomicrobiae bacterium]
MDQFYRLGRFSHAEADRHGFVEARQCVFVTAKLLKLMSLVDERDSASLDILPIC